MRDKEARAIIAKYAPPYSAMQKAMRKAYGVTTRRDPKPNRNRHRQRTPSKRDMEECRKQRVGVSYGN